MRMLKFIKPIKKNKIILHIPDEFDSDVAEITVLPYKRKAKNLQTLLNVSVWNDEDIEIIEQAIKGFKNWKIEYFN